MSHNINLANGNPLNISNSSLLLSGLYEKTGNYENALTAFVKGADITDSIQRKDNIRKATELSMNFDFEKKVLMSVEGPVDVLEYGDSVMGHYDNETKNKQNLSYKNFSKVVNMMGLSAIVIPTNKHATGILIICKSTPNHIFYMMRLADELKVSRSELETDYFSIQNDFKGGF